MTPVEKLEQMVADVAARSEVPEGMSFYLVTDDPVLARAVAPLLAADLYPTMTFGRVLHAEPMDAGYEVVLEVK